MMDIVGKRAWYFLISGILIVVSVVSLAVFWFTPSIDFTGGTMLSMKFVNPVDYTAFTAKLSELGYGDAVVQVTGQTQFDVRTKETIPNQQVLVSTLSDTFGELVDAPDVYSLAPREGANTTRNAAIAVGISMLGMLLYVTYAFRKMPSSFRWGTCFVLALLHDILVTLGLFSLLGHFLGWEMDLMFITGILAIVGVSLDNTIVVFDRMRENQRNGVSPDFEVVVNRSQIETLGRSLNTSITILITCIALMLFVGGSIENFIIALVIGIIAGTFDSVFVAPGLLVVWDKGNWGGFFKKKTVTTEVQS
ncbi:MAG: protein translocase subunit SecF [Dehalococcoidales bacterium]|nr:protein translocase subunit SecF [Dehalococcoidales bacterium]